MNEIPGRSISHTVQIVLVKGVPGRFGVYVNIIMHCRKDGRFTVINFSK
jgi:hypothetical protein